MSAFLLGMGFRADMGTCIRKLVLLKLIDACEDDGSRIFPAIATVARAAQCSDRQVQREIRSFVEIGLLSLVREGGKGRRSTNEYAMNLDVLSSISKAGWDAVAASEGQSSKGDTESPLDDAVKGDTGDTDRVTQEAAKGDNGSRTTPPDPSLDPSIERDARESEREGSQPEVGVDGDDPKAVDRAFWRLVKDWPGFAGMPKEPARKAWSALSADDRAEAERKFPHWLALLRSHRKSHVPAPSTYFNERLWRDVPEPAEPAMATSEIAAPFGRLWMAARLKVLLAGPTGSIPALTAYQRTMVAEGKLSERDLLADRQSKFGYPTISAMHEAANHRRGVTVSLMLQPLTECMEPVPVGSDVYAAWATEHHKRGWPWIPDPGGQRVVYFPAGGPGSLEAFEQAVKAHEGNVDDGNRTQAAE